MSGFGAVSAVQPLGEGRFAVDLHPGWTIGGHPNGGYLLALLGRAASETTSHAHPVAASAAFLASPDPGPAVVVAELLREGRGTAVVRARLEQEGRPCVEALLTLAPLPGDDVPVRWDDAVPERSTARLQDAVPLRIPEGFIDVRLFDEVAVAIEPESAAFLAGVPRGRGEIRGWLDLGPDEVVDPYALLFAVDSFPPATLDIAITGWVPTLQMSAYVRALPAPGPLQVLHRAHLVHGDRVDETCTVWDSRGVLVAQGHQLAGVRLP
ncbi:thioesterase family protein [Nocardioides fonticola]|uniref:Thioesterase family protein n=1 Tax=Nocardioides fonticola TaxID=450363 RepID=A0ABP7Y3B3_9ACTN